MRATARRLAREERGGVLPLVGLSLTVILGFAALAIDVTHQQALDAQLEATADAAALAAASRLPNEAEARETAIDYAKSNMPPTRHGTVLDDSDIVFGTWYGETRTFVVGGPVRNAVQVTTRRSERNGNPAPTFFMRIFGRHQA
ncbi:MAG: TadG family pilus assembly protein, partial [Gemmatimonadales bacterium]